MSDSAADKLSVEELAVLGGSPLFDEPLLVGRPNVGDQERLFERLRGALDTRWLTNGGPLVRELEDSIARLTGARHAIAVTNATVGLQIVSRVLGLSGEVIVPSFTFVASAHALAWLGIRPVFCDIDPDTLTLDPAMVERLIGPSTSAILGVHLWGRICDTDRLDAIARKHDIRVIYDAAHALACSRDGRPGGTFGDAEVFSFHATKVINSFEGGMITTNSDDIAESARLELNFGISEPDRTELLGTNGKMHEASAAMGLTSLEILDDVVAANFANLDRYAHGLAGTRGIDLVETPSRADWNAHYVAARVDARNSTLTRDELLRVLHAENVLARRYFYPGCHRLLPYAEQPGSTPLPLPHTEALADEVLVFPTGTAVSPTEIDRLCRLIGFASDNGAAIKSSLETQR